MRQGESAAAGPHVQISSNFAVSKKRSWSTQFFRAHAQGFRSAHLGSCHAAPRLFCTEPTGRACSALAERADASCSCCVAARPGRALCVSNFGMDLIIDRRPSGVHHQSGGGGDSGGRGTPSVSMADRTRGRMGVDCPTSLADLRAQTCGKLTPI